MTKIVAVFGSARIKPDVVEYQQTYEVGYALAKAGFSVMTGGYEGVMEAASKGASEGGGHVIGVASKPIEILRSTRPNPWVNEVINFDSLHERLSYLVRNSDAYVVMPGGLGTLNELILAWELIRVKDISPRPLVCYGDYWETMLANLRTTHYLDEKDWSCLQVAHTPAAIVETIHRFGQ